MEYLHIRIIELLQEKGISKTRICKDLDVALRTKRKIFSYKIQKPLLKRNLKKDA